MNETTNRLTACTTHVKIKTATDPNRWYKVTRVVMSFDASPRPRIVQLRGGAQVPARLVTAVKEN